MQPILGAKERLARRRIRSAATAGIDTVADDAPVYAGAKLALRGILTADSPAMSGLKLRYSDWVTRRDIFKQSRFAALAEWRQLIA